MREENSFKVTKDNSHTSVEMATNQHQNSVMMLTISMGMDVHQPVQLRQGLVVYWQEMEYFQFAQKHLC